MGFFKSIFRGLTMSTEELIADSQKVIDESNREMVTHYKETEGLDYKKSITKNKVWGIEKECGEVESVMLFSDRIRFRCQFKNRDLLFKDIVNLEVLTDTQIEEKSKLGQMMLIGVFTLGTKTKTEEVVSRKLVINAKECGIEFSIIIDTLHDALTVAKELNPIIEEYKKNT